MLHNYTKETLENRVEQTHTRHNVSSLRRTYDLINSEPQAMSLTFFGLLSGSTILSIMPFILYLYGKLNNISSPFLLFLAKLLSEIVFFILAKKS